MEEKEKMKKGIVLSIMACMFLSGCGVRICMADENTDRESSVGFFHVQTSYYERYSMDRKGDSCKVKGTLHQAADDDNAVLTYITAADGGGSVSVTGSMKCTEGNLRLVYMAPDGTETLIADGTDRKINAQVNVEEGEGSIGFTSEGEGAVCDFGIKMKTDGGVTLDSIMERERIEDGESIEGAERIEPAADQTETREANESMEANLEDIGLDEIENNWPESIRYYSNGSSANPMSTGFEVDAPMTVSVSCATRDGKLRLKIVRHGVLGEIGETVYLDETNPDGEYAVELDKKGQYKVLFYAKEHVGSVAIIPEDD